MSHSITIKGAAGELRWGYHKAASLGPWSMKDATLTAAVLSSDAFKVSQQPLTFVVTRESGVVWSWPIEVLQIDGRSLTAAVRQE